MLDKVSPATTVWPPVVELIVVLEVVVVESTTRLVDRGHLDRHADDDERVGGDAVPGGEALRGEPVGGGDTREGLPRLNCVRYGSDCP